MSYSFSVSASNKDEAKTQISDKLDEVAYSQPVHAVDRDMAQANAEAVLSILADPNDEQKITGSVSGYVSWQGENNFTSANISASFTLTPKE